MSITGHIISHTHWDREWFLTSKYTAEWLLPFFDSLFRMLEEYPEYCFVLDGQTIMIEDYLNQLSSSGRSLAEKKLRKYVGQSRLLAGPYYLQPDWRLVSGESLVRNMMLGHQMSEELGGVMKVGWLLDNFGQISQAPQIHKGFGISGVFLWRGIDVDPEHINSEYLWESPDGSQVTSVYLLNSYRNAMRLAEYSEISQQRIKNEVDKISPYATTDNVLLMNGYDQEMIPDDVLPLLEKLNVNSNGTRFIQTTPIRYMETIQKENHSLHILKGAQNSGRYISIFPGTLSARMYLKQMNSTCENLLTKWSEPISAWLWSLGGKYPETSIEYAWKELLRNHPHDNICGVSIDDVHSDMEARYKQCKETSEKIIARALTTISNNINTKHEKNIVAFNPSPWKRDCVVKAALEVNDGFSIYEAETDKPVPYQIGSKNGRLTDVYFSAYSIPGVGYKTFYLSDNKTATPLPAAVRVSADNYSMENNFLKVEIESNGSITVFDKTTARQFSSIGYFEDGADSGDTYNYSYPKQDLVINSLNSKARISLLDHGPLLARFKIELTMDLPVSLLNNRKKRSEETRRFPIVTFVQLEANSPRLDFHTKLINVVKDHRLRVVFPTFLEAKYSYSDTPYNVDENPISFHPYAKELPESIKRIMIGARESVPGSNLPLNSFVYLNDRQIGAALLTRGLTEYEIIEKHKIALTLFRSVGWLARTDLLTRVGDAGPMIFTPEAQCLRNFDFHYSFMPFQNRKNGLLFRQAEQFNTGIEVIKTGRHKGTLEDERGFLCLNADNDSIIISAIKKSQKDNNLVIRLFNPKADEANGVLTFSDKIKQAWTVNLNEEFQSDLSFTGYSVNVKVPAKKIITLAFQFEPGSLAKHIKLSGTKILSYQKKINEIGYSNIKMPAIVTEKDILREKKRAIKLSGKLAVCQKKLEEIESRITSVENKKALSILKRERTKIWGEVTTLNRAELEARLSSILTEKKHIELYELDETERNEKLRNFDSIIRSIGLELNAARVDKRVAEYISELYNSHE